MCVLASQPWRQSSYHAFICARISLGAWPRALLPTALEDDWGECFACASDWALAPLHIRSNESASTLGKERMGTPRGEMLGRNVSMRSSVDVANRDKYRHHARGMGEAGGRSVAASPGQRTTAALGPLETEWQAVLSEPGFTLRRYATAAPEAPPVLIVPAPIKRP
jgi:hypothetical protein